MGVVCPAELVLDDEVATEEDGELELIGVLDERVLERIEDDDDNEDEDEGDGLAVDVTELVEALLDLDEVEDSEVDGTMEMELLDAVVGDTLEMDELLRLELDGEAAFELLEDDELALPTVSESVLYPKASRYTYMLVATELLEGVILETVVCQESAADEDCKVSEEEVDRSEDTGVVELLDVLAEGSEEVALVIYTTVSGPVGNGASCERC